MRSNQYVIGAALTIVLLLMYSDEVTRAGEPNWPQFRGPNCSGMAPEGQAPPVEFGPKHNLLWRIHVSSGHSSPCVWGNNIFLTGYIKEKKKLEVFCIDRSNGNILWHQIVPTEQIEKVHPISSPVTATPAADGERVYVYFGSCGLFCYDFAGKQQWIVPLPIPKTRFGSGTSPIVVGELVILNRDEQNDPYLVAFDRHTGRIVWKTTQPIVSKLGVTSYSTPVIWKNRIVIHRVGEVVAHSLEQGKRILSISIPTMGSSTPVTMEDHLYVGAWTNFGEPELRDDLPDFRTLIEQCDKNNDKQLNKGEFPSDLAMAHRPEAGDIPGATVYVKPFFNMLDSDGNEEIGEVEWNDSVALISSFCKKHGLLAIKSEKEDDSTEAYISWQVNQNVPEVPSPLYYNGRIYMIKNGGIISCVDAQKGRVLYRERLGASGPYYSSPVVANSKIYIASAKGVITVFKSGDNLEILAQNDIGEEIFATPAVVDNKLYVRTVRLMYAFGE